MIIDLVFSGGGVKAIAFIGVVEALEERGIKVRRIAGTSAGALVGALVAASYTSAEIKTMLPPLSELFYKEKEQRWWVPTWLRWIQLYWKKGLYTGDGLLEWLELRLQEKGIRTFDDLPQGSFKMVASDLTAGKMVVLPDDAVYYGRDPQAMHVAKAVRMSASLPFFFQPVKLKKGKHSHLIVDGGVLSNFPIWLLEEKGAKKEIPIIGFQLQAENQKEQEQKINNVIELYSALFITMKEAHDVRHLEKIGKRKVLIIPVPELSSTDTSLTPKQIHTLISTGRAQTLRYLDRLLQ
ncbi:patatin-like phospholipase family protein [Jeotgalibacillus marinus]|uniref:Patatin-like phospholipase family protein n=1 Tax=Jeotgalibacillus marinus TaxID=86667 RepID=A0ABV3PZI1_9BACL